MGYLQSFFILKLTIQRKREFVTGVTLSMGMTSPFSLAPLSNIRELHFDHFPNNILILVGL